MAASMDDLTAASAMLDALFGQKEEGAHVVLFQLDPARSTSFVDLDAAAAFAAGQPNVWLHVGLTRRPFAGGDRPKAAEIDGLCGLGADIDIAGPAHKKAGLPPTFQAAMAVVDAIGLPYGLLVHSGHGLQPWWPFAEPWMFEDDAERHRAQVLLRAFGITVRERARALGCTVDMTFDLPRLFRLAGTQNAKLDPVPVRLLEQTGAVVSEDDVMAILLDGAWEQAERDISGRRASGDAVSYGELVLDPKAEPPWEKLDILRELEPRFDQSWRRARSKRTEMWSASEWDQSLASYAAQAGWSRQEIANLLLASRRKHGDDQKTNRQDYYRMTIDKATAGRAEHEAIREAVAVAEELATASTPPSERTDTERADMLAQQARAIGVEITRITRSRSEPPVFGIETPHGSGTLGGVEALVSNRKFRLKVTELTNRIPRKLKDEVWEPIAQALLELAELEELGIEATVAGRAETLVSLYLGQTKPQPVANMDASALKVLPVRLSPYVDRDGRVRLFSAGFKVWLAEVHHEVMTAQEIGTMLRTIGAEPVHQNFTIDGRRTQRALWVLPRTVGESE